MAFLISSSEKQKVSLYHIFLLVRFTSLLNLRGKKYIGGVFSFGLYLQKLCSGQGIGSSWFIAALLVVEFMAFGLSYLPTIARYLLTTALGLFGFYLNSILSQQLFWNVNTAFVGLVFFEAAQACKGKIEKLILHPKGKWLSFACMAAVSVLCTVFNSSVDMSYRLYGNILIFLVGAFAGIYLLIFACMSLEHTKGAKRIFTYLGQNTLPIIEFHYVQGYMVTETLYWKLFKLQYGNNVFSGNIEGFVQAITVLVLLVPVIEVMNRFVPWMVGKRTKGVESYAK